VFTEGLRSAGGVLVATIYLVILTNKMTTNTEIVVVSAVLEAGLPECLRWLFSHL
jgi:hypothetical protein